MKTMDQIVRENSAFKSLEAMLDTHHNYRPSIDVSDKDRLAMADAYDEMQVNRGDDRRAFRYGTPFKNTYAGVAKEFRKLAKETMAHCRKNNPSQWHYKHRGCEIIMLDKNGYRHEGYDPDYLDMNEVSGVKVKKVVDQFLNERNVRLTPHGDDPICGFSLDGGIDCYDSFQDAMKYPDDYEPFFDSYEVSIQLEDIK